jgi:hypothetical protein
MMINMSTAIPSQTSSMSNGSISSNAVELINLVALFYGKGDVNTANALLRALNK